MLAQSSANPCSSYSQSRAKMVKRHTSTQIKLDRIYARVIPSIRDLVSDKSSLVLHVICTSKEGGGVVPSWIDYLDDIVVATRCSGIAL